MMNGCASGISKRREPVFHIFFALCRQGRKGINVAALASPEENKI